MPLVVILAALCSGLAVLASGWEAFGFYAVILASCAASATAVLVGGGLALLRVATSRNAQDPAQTFDIAGLTSGGRRDLRLVPRRLYFDIEHDREIIKDEIGIEATSLDQALDDARSVIRDMVQELADDGYEEDWVLVVRDARGASVARLPIERAPVQARSDRRSA
ncbi:hypothetical protein R1A27_22280 [Methylobacterium sp. NMS12]|uniref:DUF6894 family protein n=1 Tax=Methylobacterium sp. NMS12 TaxID=3079766 RepID=UPI003F882164